MTDKISSEDFIKAFGGGVKHNLKRPQGDLISREALKNYARKVMYENNATNFSLIKMFDEIIDGAQAVPLPNEQIAWEQGYECGYHQAKEADV